MNRIPITEDNLQHYIDKFLEGNTDNAEEQAIYAYFRTHGIPEKLLPYRDMFAYFEAGMPENVLPETLQHKPHIFKAGIQKHYRLLAAVAACLALLPGSISWKYYQEQKRFANTYEGSYMIVNGQRITDLNKLRPGILSALSDAKQLEKMSQDLLWQKQQEEKQTADRLIESTSDPDMRRQLKAILYSDN